MEALLRLHDGREDRRKFTATLVGGFAESRGIRNLLRNAVNRLARRVVEHTGRTGEHCIAGSRLEWRSVGWGAVGAGSITAFTALFKYSLGSASLAPLWIGVAQSLNYAGSFLLMQALGWMLASKMPSVTAAALAHALSEQDGMHAKVNLIAAITPHSSLSPPETFSAPSPQRWSLTPFCAGGLAILFYPKKTRCTGCIP